MSSLASVFQCEKFHSMEFEGAQGSPLCLFWHSHLSYPWQISDTELCSQWALNGTGWGAGPCRLQAKQSTSSSSSYFLRPLKSENSCHSWACNRDSDPVTSFCSRWGLQLLCKFKPFEWAPLHLIDPILGGEGSGGRGRHWEACKVKRRWPQFPHSPTTFWEEKSPKAKLGV